MTIIWCHFKAASENISACLCYRLWSASFFQVHSRLICLCCLQFEQMSLSYPILVFWRQSGEILVNPSSKGVEGIDQISEMSFLCYILWNKRKHLKWIDSKFPLAAILDFQILILRCKDTSLSVELGMFSFRPSFKCSSFNVSEQELVFQRNNV